jgi:hypothetical protein
MKTRHLLLSKLTLNFHTLALCSLLLLSKRTQADGREGRREREGGGTIMGREKDPRKKR